MNHIPGFIDRYIIDTWVYIYMSYIHEFIDSYIIDTWVYIFIYNEFHAEGYILICNCIPGYTHVYICLYTMRLHLHWGKKVPPSRYGHLVWFWTSYEKLTSLLIVNPSLQWVVLYQAFTLSCHSISSYLAFRDIDYSGKMFNLLHNYPL